ncbi:MAG: hypothetical protein HYZ58_14770 [Acidobacteria bacterium]|nr:hypothetical protein [Acidobacteriota bacterium]
MAEVVYALCAITSILCAALLLRSFRRTRARLLLWSSICFIGLAASNTVLVLDLIVFREVDLSVWRTLLGAVSLLMLDFGLLWETR